MMLLWLFVLLAVSPWLLGACLATVVLGATLFAVWRPGQQRARAYYRHLGIVAMGLATFVDVMLILGGAG